MNKNDTKLAPNASILLWAGFMAILAAGVGFAIRGGIFETWRAQFGFTGLEVGLINGGGFTGFCFGIIIGGMLADKFGYGKLVAAAFLLHLASAGVTFIPGLGTTKQMAFVYLWIGTFLFSAANGVLEAVANPLIATLFPNNRTHYLNILHASWPAGLIVGGLIGIFLGEKLGWGWKAQLSLFLVPTIAYGLMFLGQAMPRSEASQQGLSLGSMLKDVGVVGAAVIAFFVTMFVKDSLGDLLHGFTARPNAAGMIPTESFFKGPIYTGIAVAIGLAVWVGFSGASRWSVGAPLLCVLFIVHALVGAVELGTDSWIQNITGNILDPTTGKWMFVYTSLVMFLLRFCADFIEKKIGLSPVGILLVCAILACLGLNMVSFAKTTIPVMAALLVYGVGKTFFWPTMLAVVSDRFPRTGAVAISIMGGLGMMSAGLIGSPGLGYAKDRFAGEALAKQAPEVYDEFKSSTDSKWLVFKKVNGLDGIKLGEVKAQLKKLRESKSEATAEDLADEKSRTVIAADMMGDRRTLMADSFIPATMAVIYALILLYFTSIGGYKPVQIDAKEM